MSIRVLLADDHPLVREGLRMTLGRVPDITIVGEAASGDEAVEMAQRLRPEVIIMDVTMPRMNGIDATACIKAEDPSIRIVALSVHAEKSIVHAILKAGASGFVTKECVSGEIVAAIRSAMEGTLYLSRSVADFAYVGDASETLLTDRALTARQRDVLRFIARGCTSRQIAERLRLSDRTVEWYRQQIMNVTGLHSATALTRYAIENGFGILADDPAELADPGEPGEPGDAPQADGDGEGTEPEARS